MSWESEPYGIRITDTEGKEWAKLKPDSELSAESIGAWLAGYRAAASTFLSVVPKEDRPEFVIRVDVTGEITDIDDMMDILSYEQQFSKVFNAF